MILASKYLIRQSPILDISLNNNQIEQITEMKLLGVTIDQTLSWSTYIQKTVTIKSGNIAIIRSNAHLMSLKIRKIELKSIVLCHRRSHVWSCASK